MDFHPQSVPNLLCHNQQQFEVDPLPELHQNFKPTVDNQQQQQQSMMGGLGVHGMSQQIQNPYNTEQMQEFLLQKFSTQDFDLLTKNYDFFQQYYKANCPTEQQMDEKHLTMDFLSQFYHLNEFKKKLNGSEIEPDDNASGDEMPNDNDDVVALDDKDEADFHQQNHSTDAAKGKMGISNYNSNKRLRTTILPEQLNYLYECYQKESNPSRKQLEEISKKVNLKKRVVQVSQRSIFLRTFRQILSSFPQVWYQNSRARERKGQFRQNMQIINKKCPYCSAIFKVKSALESHLQTKHVDKQMINIDAIPEINFAPKDSSFSMQMPSAVADLSSMNIGQQMNVDFWKTKMMHQPQTSQFFGGHKRLSEFSESEISFTDSNNDELADEDYDMDNFNDDSNHIEDFQAAAVQPGDSNKSKRHRTHVNRVQKSILRKIFDDVKSPSMIDCENIGREIGLFKRVVQVRRSSTFTPEELS